MVILAWAIFILFCFVIVAQIANYVFHVDNDNFFAPFHFACGALVAIIIAQILGNYGAAVYLTLVVGLAWEVYEVLLWKFVLKKKKFAPDPIDTRNDLVLDLIGAMLGVAWLANASTFAKF